MNLFGTVVDLDINHFDCGGSAADEIVKTVFKRKDEREIFSDFLESVMADGSRVLDRLDHEVQLEAGNLPSEIDIDQSEMVNFVLENLRKTKDGRLDLYETIKRKIIEVENPEYVKLHHLIDRGKFDGSVPLGYPDASKRADGLLRADIRDSLDQRVREQFLVRKILTARVRDLAREMFFAINKLGLKGEELVHYLSIFFDLSLVQTGPTKNETGLKRELARALKEGDKIGIVYMKSLRYTYPDGKRLRVLDHLERSEAGTKNEGEKMIYFDEYKIIERLAELVDIFRTHGLEVNLTVLVADNDLEILFPEGNGFVPQEDVAQAQDSANAYIVALRRGVRNIAKEVCLLSDYLEEKGISGVYQDKVEVVYRDIKGSCRIVNSNEVEERINYRFEFFSGLYGDNYSRADARETMYNQIAHTMALSAVFESFRNLPIVVTDSRGLENKMIGGLNPQSRAVFLTKLKEPTIIEK